MPASPCRKTGLTSEIPVDWKVHSFALPSSPHMRSSMFCKRFGKAVYMRPWVELASTCGFASRSSRQNVGTAASKSSNNGSEPSAQSNKAAALSRALSEINDKYGKGTVMTLSSSQPMDVERISTGALTLDMALGGGLPKGRVIEVYGPESSGKTTLAMQAVASVQASGGTALLVDAEHAFDPFFAKSAGVDIKALLINQPDSGETALEVVDKMVRSSAVDIIVIDSVSALVPRAELEGEIGDNRIGLQSKLMSTGLRKIAGNASKSKTSVVFINQLRMKIGVMFGNPEITSGGLALKYYCSVRIDVRRIKTIEGPKQEQIGIRVKAKIVKNKVSAPFKIAEFDILFASGVNTLGSLVEAAEKVGVLQRKGAWYSYKDENIGQGRDKAVMKLREDKALREEIEASTRAVLQEVDINDMLDEPLSPAALEEEFKDVEEDDGVDLSNVESLGSEDGVQP